MDCSLLVVIGFLYGGRLILVIMSRYVALGLPFHLGNRDIVWECRFILGMMHDGLCDVPFYLAIYEQLFGAFRISNRVQGLSIDTAELEPNLRRDGV